MSLSTSAIPRAPGSAARARTPEQALEAVPAQEDRPICVRSSRPRPDRAEAQHQTSQNPRLRHTCCYTGQDRCAHRLNPPPRSSPGRRTSERAGNLHLHRDREGYSSGERDVQDSEGLKERLLRLARQSALGSGSSRCPAYAENYSHSQRQQRDLRCSEDPLRGEDTRSKVRKETSGEADAGSLSVRVRRSQEKEGPYDSALTARAAPHLHLIL